MKYIIAFAAIIVGINAIPQSDLYSERFVTGAIIDAINGVSQSIKDYGLDPLIVKREQLEYALPVPVIFNVVGFIEDLFSFGLSDIRINRMNYSVLTFRLSFELELPRIHISAGDANAKVTIYGEEVDGEISGSVDINRIRVAGQVQVSVGIISGISVRSITINFTLNSINSDLKLVIVGHDLSDVVNTFLGQTVPDTLLAFRSDINKLLEIVLLQVINDQL